MASETGSSEPSAFIENLINSRNRDISLFLPFILGLNATRPLQDSTNPLQETQYLDRIIIINPLTQGMVVIERSNGSSSSSNTSLGLDSWLRDLFLRKNGQPPASKTSIEAMPTVEIVNCENDDEGCVICLEELEAGQMAKEMPCKHMFHGQCIEKWLTIHGSCPVCRYKMPVDEDDDVKGKSSGEGDSDRRRDIWVSFTVSSDRRSGENDHSVPGETSDSSSIHQEMESLETLFL